MQLTLAREAHNNQERVLTDFSFFKQMVIFIMDITAVGPRGQRRGRGGTLLVNVAHLHDDDVRA